MKHLSIKSLWFRLPAIVGAALFGGFIAHAQAPEIIALKVPLQFNEGNSTVLEFDEQSLKIHTEGELQESSLGASYQTLPNPHSKETASLFVAVSYQEGSDPSFSSVVSHREALNASREMKACELRTGLRAAGIEQRALFESLIDIRAKRRDISLEKLQSRLEPGFVERLSKIEKNLGFQESQPLGPELEPTVLAFRLERLKAAIELYETFRKQPQ